MKPLFIQKPIEVSNELENLGLCDEGLLRAVNAVVTARNNCTSNDVPSARGLRGWLDGHRALRDFYCQKGWEKNEDDHISSLFHRERLIKVLVSNTDDATGLELEGRQPQNRNRKGPATNRAISINAQQLSLFDGFDEYTNIVPLNPQQISSIQHWFLCVYCHEDIVRAEISFPSVCEAGFFTGYHKRIILVGEDTDDGTDPSVKIHRDGPDGEGNFEIPVIRKQA